MAITLDLSETERPDKVGEYERVAPGPVHLMVLEVKENGGKNGEHLIKFEVLMHPEKGQIGLTHTEYFPAEAKMAWKLLNLCYAVKIADREAMARAKATGSNYVPIELQDAVGRQLFATIKVTAKEGKEFHNIDNVLSIDDPKAANHPRNVGMLAQATRAMGLTSPTAGVGSQSAGQHATQSAAAVASPAADPFANVT